MTDPFTSAIDHHTGRQQRNITRAQLLDVGLSSNAIANRLKTGSLRRTPYPGVYTVGTPAVTPYERAFAALLASGLGAVLSHSSAMTLWGFWKYWDQTFEVTITQGDRRPKGVRVHRSRTLSPRDTTRQYGIPVTSPARTIFDMAPRLSDRRLNRLINGALHDKVLSLDDLAEIVARFPNHPTSKRLRPFVETTGNPTESELEDDLFPFCDEWGIPRPVTGLYFNGFRVDAMWVEEQVIAECDGWGFHNTRIDFETDRARDSANLAADAPTVRITRWRMKNQPAELAGELHKILANRRRALAA